MKRKPVAGTGRRRKSEVIELKGKFTGGVHPHDHKDTRESPIQSLPKPDELRISLLQHIGAPASATVSPGDRVLKYQTIAGPSGYVSSSLHAPTSGTVKAVEPSPHPSGRLIPSIIIEPDGKDEELDVASSADPDLKEGPEVWKKMVQDAGIVGMGGAAFPTHVKLSPPDDKPIDLLVANGVECEPFLTADHRLMLEEPETFLGGLHLAMEMIGAKRAFIGIEANKPDAVEKVRSMDLPGGFEVEVLPVMYPQGAEKQLIYALTGREVPTGGLPMDVGVVVQNVGTLAAIHEAVTMGRPLVERVMTLGGTMPKGPGNYRVAIGTALSHIVENTGGLKGPAAKIINGGPMMGQALAGFDSTVTKGTSGLLVFGPGESRALKPRACVRCGTCVRSCPASLMPHTLGNLVEWDQFDSLEEYHIGDCIECGCCTYICPADRNLVQWIRQGKAEIIARSK
ncbi:electron transport complex subunit RsxC [bacterium]|nr:MAG: electron transport complex subunit RsxC [bacterium]